MPLDLATTTVVIDSPVAGTAALISGCDSVLGQGHCLLGTAGKLDHHGAWSAEVSPVDVAGLIVRITLYRGSKDQGPYLERTISYGTKDSIDQRARATGIVIAAGVVAALSLSPESEPPPAPVPPSAPPPAPAPKLENSHTKAAPARATEVSPPRENVRLRFNVDALIALEQGLLGDEPLLGGRLRAGLTLPALPLRYAIALRYAEATHSKRFGLQRFGAELGFALHSDRLPWLEPRLSALVVCNRLEAEDATTGRNESARAYRYGALGGVELLWPLYRDWSVLLGAEGTVLGPSYNLTVAGKALGSEELLGYGVVLGVRLGKM